MILNLTYIYIYIYVYTYVKDIRRSTSPIAILIQAANWAPRGRRGSTLQGSQGLGMHSMQDSGHGDRHKACFFTAAKSSTSSSIPCLREMVGLRNHHHHHHPRHHHQAIVGESRGPKPPCPLLFFCQGRGKDKARCRLSCHARLLRGIGLGFACKSCSC